MHYKMVQTANSVIVKYALKYPCPKLCDGAAASRIDGLGQHTWSFKWPTEYDARAKVGTEWKISHRVLLYGPEPLARPRVVALGTTQNRFHDLLHS